MPDLLGIEPLQHNWIAKHTVKCRAKGLLEQLKVSPNLNVVTRRPRLYHSRSRVTFLSKVDLLSLNERTDKRICNCQPPELEAIDSTLVHIPLAPVVQGGKILPVNHGGRGQFA
jgi:hypothetical protein